MPAAELARELGVTTSAVCAWLAGKKMPTVPRLLAIAQRFGTTVDALLSEQQP
jgi:transcriptional regulator with XRE-family HTH domain